MKTVLFKNDESAHLFDTIDSNFSELRGLIDGSIKLLEWSKYHIYVHSNYNWDIDKIDISELEMHEDDMDYQNTYHFAVRLPVEFFNNVLHTLLKNDSYATYVTRRIDNTNNIIGISVKAEVSDLPAIEKYEKELDLMSELHYTLGIYSNLVFNREYEVLNTCRSFDSYLERLPYRHKNLRSKQFRDYNMESVVKMARLFHPNEFAELFNDVSKDIKKSVKIVELRDLEEGEKIVYVNNIIEEFETPYIVAE